MDDPDESEIGPPATCRSCGGAVDRDDCLPLSDGGVLCASCADDDGEALWEALEAATPTPTPSAGRRASRP